MTNFNIAALVQLINRYSRNTKAVAVGLKDFFSPTAQDVTIAWEKDDGTDEAWTVPNFKKWSTELNIQNQNGKLLDLDGDRVGLVVGQQLLFVYPGGAGLSITAAAGQRVWGKTIDVEIPKNANFCEIRVTGMGHRESTTGWMSAAFNFAGNDDNVYVMDAATSNHKGISAHTYYDEPSTMAGQTVPVKIGLLGGADDDHLYLTSAEIIFYNK